MNTNKPSFTFGISESIHFLTIIAMAWLVIVSYIEPSLLLGLYAYLFNDISFRSIPKLIGMHSDAEIAYFILSNIAIFALHLNLLYMYVLRVNLREEWTQNKLPLSEILNKKLWASFWPYYAIRVFRLRNYHYENGLENAIKKLLRDETYIDLLNVILAVAILYPLLYSSLFTSDFLSIFGWQFITPLFLFIFWNQILCMFVLVISLIKEQRRNSKCQRQ